MLYNKIQPQSLLSSEEEVFYHIDWRHLVQWHGSIRTNYQYLSTEGPISNLVKIAQAISEKKTLKNNTILYMYIAQGQEQITPRGQNFDCN